MAKKKTTDAAVASINYPFTAIPTIFIYKLDAKLLQLLGILIQAESYWSNNKPHQLVEGYFYKTASELIAATKLHKADFSAAIETLYRWNLIDVKNEKKGKKNYYKVNFETIRILSLETIEEAVKHRIEPLKRGCKLTYLNNSSATVVQVKEESPSNISEVKAESSSTMELVLVPSWNQLSGKVVPQWNTTKDNNLLKNITTDNNLEEVGEGVTKEYPKNGCTVNDSLVVEEEKEDENTQLFDSIFSECSMYDVLDEEERIHYDYTSMYQD